MLRAAYKTTDRAEGKKIAERIVDSFPSCPIPEIARLGRTLRTWKEAFLAYFDTGATNGGTEAIIIWSPIWGVIDVADRVAGRRRRHVIWSVSPTLTMRIPLSWRLFVFRQARTLHVGDMSSYRACRSGRLYPSGLQITTNGLIELHRRIARGFRNRENYRLRMLLIAGGLTHPNLTPPPQV